MSPSRAAGMTAADGRQDTVLRPERRRRIEELLIAGKRGQEINELEGGSTGTVRSVRADLIARGYRFIGHGQPMIAPDRPPAAEEPEPDEDGDAGRVLARLKRSREPLGFDELADASDLSPGRLRRALERIRSIGRGLVETPEGFVLATGPAPARSFELEDTGQWRRFALVSDTHGGSKHEQLRALHEFYDVLEREGVELALHAGDITHGRKVYQGQEHDLKVLSYPGQAEHVARTFPRRQGVRTMFITGNHDEDAIKRGSEDPGRAVDRLRDDMQYLGTYGALVNLGGLKVRLQHGAGSPSYALSYKLQKYLEKIPRGRGDSPHIYALGHYHQAHWMPGYQGIEAFLPYAFEGRNLLLERLGIWPRPGAWIIEARLENNRVAEIKPRLYQYDMEDGHGDNGTETITAGGSSD